MEEFIKCPHCGENIPLEEFNEDEHLKILSAVKNSEFEKELSIEKEKIKKTLELESSLKMHEEQAKVEQLKAEYTAKIENNQKDIELAVVQRTSQKEKEFEEKNRELQEKAQKLELELERQKNNFESQLKGKDSEIEFYKDYKLKLTTKMVGESLEKYCETEFNKIRKMAYPNAYFEKDNEVVAGSKGDYIFRNYDIDGIEICSIIFDMKNEADDTVTKHKNEEFFAKLDKDRQNKKCEYAVLVSTLEAENEYYNQGIVETYQYEKMFVVRPQNFLSIISLINNISMNTIESKKELKLYQEQHIELLAFEEAFNNWKDDASKTLGYYSNNVAELRKKMVAMRKSADDVIKILDTMEKQIGTSSKKIEAGNVEKFAKNSPTMLLELKNGKKKKRK